MMEYREKLKKALHDPRVVIRALRERFLYGMAGLNNAIVDLFKSNSFQASGFKELDEIAIRSLVRTDISDHLATLFVESVCVHPRLIVELGVRGGESTFVLERVARLCGSKLVSVDLEDCSKASTFENWLFVRSDDIEFAQGFERWCLERSIEPEVEVLYIDTSHTFEHTLLETRFWFPFLSTRAKVFLHDTNLRKVYFRNDRSIGIGWDNQRGVIAALEQYFGKSFDEKNEFTDFVNGWRIKHYPWCAGFTILEKIGSLR